MTLSEALREGLKRGIYEWRVVPADDGGLIRFMIHPLSKDGVTLDFTLDQAVGGHELLLPDKYTAEAQWRPKE